MVCVHTCVCMCARLSERVFIQWNVQKRFAKWHILTITEHTRMCEWFENRHKWWTSLFFCSDVKHFGRTNIPKLKWLWFESFKAKTNFNQFYSSFGFCARCIWKLIFFWWMRTLYFSRERAFCQFIPSIELCNL